MSDHSDLPLFSWTPPPCQILPFPETRRVWRVRRSAETLSTGTEKQIARYRQQIFEGVENRLLKVGVEPALAAAERTRFEEAVANEMRRIAYEGARSVPDEGGAA